jgi:hypothetical protein
MAGATERVILGAPVAGARGTVASSFQYLLRGDETLQLEVYNFVALPVVVRLFGRVWRTESQDLQVFAHDTSCGARVFTTKTFSLTAGALLNLRLTTDDTTVPLGQLYGRVRLMQGDGAAALPIATLIQGYFNDRGDRGWPGSAIEDTHAGLGTLRNEAWSFGGVPPTIAGFTQAKMRSRVTGGSFLFSTAAIGAAREVILIITNSTGIEIARLSSNYAHAPSTVAAYTLAAGVNQDASSASGQRIIPIPTDLDLPAQSSLTVVVVNQQVGDLFTPGALYMRSWMDFNAE